MVDSGFSGDIHFHWYTAISNDIMNLTNGISLTQSLTNIFKLLNKFNLEKLHLS